MPLTISPAFTIAQSALENSYTLSASKYDVLVTTSVLLTKFT